MRHLFVSLRPHILYVTRARFSVLACNMLPQLMDTWESKSNKVTEHPNLNYSFEAKIWSRLLTFFCSLWINLKDFFLIVHCDLKPLCREAISFSSTFSTSVTISSDPPSASSPCPSDTLALRSGIVALKAEWIPVIKASAVFILASSLQDSAPESDITSAVDFSEFTNNSKGAFKFYISTFGGGVQNLGKPAYIILARSLKWRKQRGLSGYLPGWGSGLGWLPRRAFLCSSLCFFVWWSWVRTIGVSSASVIDGRFSFNILYFSMLAWSVSDTVLDDPDEVLFFL